jgi:hypothetical protein
MEAAVRSMMERRSRVNGFVPNLGRDLVRLPRTKSAGLIAQRAELCCTPPVPGLRAVVR